MSVDRRWVQRLIDEERTPALILLLSALIAIAFANLADGSVVSRVLQLGPSAMPLQGLASEGLLVIFFYVAGLELRHELTVGSLQSFKAAAVPVLGAILGMLVPAVIFIALDPAFAKTAWGLPIATDLPLALALLAIAGRGLPSGFRAFILTLAIVDDALSILVIALAFGSHISFGWIAVTALLVAAYAWAIARNGATATALALASWYAMLHTGIHPTVLGVALGLVTAGNTERIRDRWQPISGFVAVPLFVATALSVKIDAGAIDGRLIASLTLARVIGKPLGIWCGAALAVRLLRPEHHLPLPMYLRAGAVAALGFSVSLLFADLALPVAARPSAVVAILVGLIAAALAGTITLRRTPTTL